MRLTNLAILFVNLFFAYLYFLDGVRYLHSDETWRGYLVAGIMSMQIMVCYRLLPLLKKRNAG